MASCVNTGGLLLILSSATASQIARGRSTEEISILAALFTTIGDLLALLATLPAPCGSNPKESVSL